MALHCFYDQGVAYNMGHSPYYERESYWQPYHDAAPGMYRREGRRYEPYFDNYRRDYRQWVPYADCRYGVLPEEEVFRRVEAPQWMDGGYRHGGQVGRYRVDRRDYHGGQSYGHANFLDLEDDYDRRNHSHHNNHHLSRREVELYVPICCDECERKLRKHLEYLEGVEAITVDHITKKVVVFGNVNPSNVLNRARQDKPRSDFWHPRYR